MAFSRRLLNEGEDVVFTTRTHVKALLVPAVLLIVLLGLAGYLTGISSGAAWPWVIWIIAGAFLLALVVWPFLNWLAATYTVTNRRLITRKGVLTRTGHDIPLNRISDVSYERDVLDRMLGCGTLIVRDASERGEVRLPDVPHVEDLQLKMSDLLFHRSKGVDDGT